jgi:hypothetical protein
VSFAKALGERTRASVLMCGVAGVALFARDPGGCGSIESPTAGLHAPCTRDKDCEGALLCREGSCELSVVDGGVGDAGDASAQGGDASDGGIDAESNDANTDSGDASMTGDAQQDV